MGFRTGAYAKVWSVEQGRGRFQKVRLSVSRKNKDTGEYDQEFSGFCMFIGNANAKAERLKEGDRIRLGDVDVSNKYDREAKREYVDFKVFDFEFADSAPQQQPAASENPVTSNPVESEEESLPF